MSPAFARGNRPAAALAARRGRLSSVRGVREHVLSTPMPTPESSPDSGLRTRLEATFWTRHSNPWSGGTRHAVSPVLAYALYRRDWRLLGLALAFAAVNPVLFPPPRNTDNWLSHAVLAERA